MNITIRDGKYRLSPDDQASLEEKLLAPLRIIGEREGKGEKDSDEMFLDIEVAAAPAEGRSATPCRLVANLTVNGNVYHAEAVKPNPGSAADRVRRTLEAELRRSHGRTRRLWRRGGLAFKRMARFGR